MPILLQMEDGLQICMFGAEGFSPGGGNILNSSAEAERTKTVMEARRP